MRTLFAAFAAMLCFAQANAQLAVSPCPVSLDLDSVQFLVEPSSMLTNSAEESYDLIWIVEDYVVSTGWQFHVADPNIEWAPFKTSPEVTPGDTMTFNIPAASGGTPSSVLFRVFWYTDGQPGSGACSVLIYEQGNPSNRTRCDFYGSAALTSTGEPELISLQVYPNPASEVLMTEAPAGVDAWLIDMTGRQLAHIPAQGLDVSSYPDGLYMVNWMRDGQSLLTKPVVLSH